MQHRDAFLAKQFAFFGQPVVILDLEATGGHLAHDRITEIAFLRFDGTDVVKYTQLINPQQQISEFISNLTGIDNEMVANAPTFDQVLPEILPLLRNSILVAHNSRFDYNLLRNECRRAGIPFSSPCLCTVKLSKALYPNEYKHNLDAIAARFRLTSHGNRHRAWTDVAMLADFLQAALFANQEKWQAVALNLLSPTILPPETPTHIRDALSHFSDDHGVVAIHTADQVMLSMCQHAYQETVSLLHHKPLLLSEINHIDFFPTIGILHSLSVYARLAREHEIYLGSSGRHTVEFYQEQGCLKAKVCLLKNGFYAEPPTGVFIYPKAAKKAIQEWANQHQICPNRLGILPFSLPKSSPCPVATATSCVCEREDLLTHNQKVKQMAITLPTADWHNHPRLCLRETDELSNQYQDFIVERGALLLDNDEWFVSYELFSILKQKFKSERHTINVL